MRVSAATDTVTISAPGISLTALDDGTVQVRDQSGVARVTLGGYRLVWTPPATDGGTASAETLTGGIEAIRIDYKVKGDPGGKIRIQGQFSVRANRVHLRYDVWGPDDLNPAGAMIGCTPARAGSTTSTVKLGRWTRSPAGGAPYEVPDTSLFGFKWPDEAVYLDLHGNTDWRDQSSVHFPAHKLEAGHFAAEGDLVITSLRPAAVGAILHGRPVALDIWTDHPYNLWSDSTTPFELKTQTINTSDSAKTITLTWTAHDFDGRTVAAGTERHALSAGQSWDRPLRIPAPAQGLVFVDVTASNGTDDALSRTTLAVLPPHAYTSGDESLFGLSSFFPLPTEHAAETLIARIGVRWLRAAQLSAARASTLGISQNSLVGMPPSGKPDSYDADPQKKTAWIDKVLSDADLHNCRYVELFNEWNMTGGLNTGNTAEMYTKDWLIPFVQERKKKAAHVKIMSMGLAGLDTVYLDKVHDAGGWDLFDALALHPGRGWYTADYGGVEQEPPIGKDFWSFLGAIEGANSLMAKYGRKDLYVTEAYASTPPNDAWHDTYRHAAENVLLSYALAAANGVRVMDWYQLNDSVWYDQGGANDKDSEYHYGLLNRDLSPKPSLLAYAAISSALDGARFVRWIQFGSGHSHGLLFTTPRGPMTVLWDRSDGYRLNTAADPVTKKFLSPEPWADDWITKVVIRVRASGKSVRQIDCIGRERVIPVTNGSARITLNGAPRIYYGIQPD